MNKFFKWIGIVLASLFALITIIFFVMALKGNTSITQTFDVSAENVVIPTDSESIARGEHWVKAECIGCHKDDLSGDSVFLSLLSEPLNRKT